MSSAFKDTKNWFGDMYHSKVLLRRFCCHYCHLFVCSEVGHIVVNATQCCSYQLGADVRCLTQTYTSIATLLVSQHLGSPSLFVPFIHCIIV